MNGKSLLLKRNNNGSYFNSKKGESQRHKTGNPTPHSNVVLLNFSNVVLLNFAPFHLA
jgi:hypothetical protein